MELEGADAVSGQFLDVGDHDADDAVGIGSSCGPVLVALDAGALLQSRHHDDGGHFLLPAHPPEVGERLRKRSLETQK